MKTNAIILFFILCFSNSEKTNAQYLIPRSVLANGGTTGTNTQFQIAGTIGQAASGPSSNGNFSIVAGFWGQVHGTPVSVESPFDDLPATFRLDQNYPNPFNPVTNIRFSLPASGLVSLKVYDLLGKEVATLVNQVRAAGSYTEQFNPSGLASGTYLYRLTTPTHSATKKLMLVR